MPGLDPTEFLTDVARRACRGYLVGWNEGWISRVSSSVAPSVQETTTHASWCPDPTSATSTAGTFYAGAAASCCKSWQVPSNDRGACCSARLTSHLKRGLVGPLGTFHVMQLAETITCLSRRAADRANLPSAPD